MNYLELIYQKAKSGRSAEAALNTQQFSFLPSR
jgi:hypothetical protein